MLRKFGVSMIALLPVLAAAVLRAGNTPSDAAAGKLGTFLGKWQTEAAFAGGMKATSDLECRWSPQGNYLVCEQRVKLPDREQRQLTVYSYNAKEGVYRYSTFSDPGVPPSTGVVDINGNIWTYNSSFENNGKTTKIRNTNQFTDSKTEVFKVVRSTDGGSTWMPLLQGSGHKVGD